MERCPLFEAVGPGDPVVRSCCLGECRSPRGSPVEPKKLDRAPRPSQELAGHPSQFGRGHPGFAAALVSRAFATTCRSRFLAMPSSFASHRSSSCGVACRWPPHPAVTASGDPVPLMNQKALSYTRHELRRFGLVRRSRRRGASSVSSSRLATSPPQTSQFR